MSDASIFGDDPALPENRPLRPRKFRGPTITERVGDNNWGDPVGPRQSLVVSNAAVRLTPPADARAAMVTVDTNPVRFTVDGTTPTAAIGTPVAAGGALEITGDISLRGIQFIRSAAADATLQVEYFN